MGARLSCGVSARGEKNKKKLVTPPLPPPAAAQSNLTALILAAYNGKEQCVKDLLEAGADVDVKDKVRR